MLRRIRAERKVHTDTREDGETCQRKAEAAAIGAGGKRSDVKDLPSEVGWQRSIDFAEGVRNHERCRVGRPKPIVSAASASGGSGMKEPSRQEAGAIAAAERARPDRLASM